jgi:hypothetical protein
MWTLFDRPKTAKPAAHRWNLNEPLVWLSPHDPWTIGDAVQGVQIWGSTGSAKTTGSLAWLLKAYLKAGFGGLLLTVKPTDREFYEKLCRDTGRSADLLLFGHGHGHGFNFLDAELSRTDRGAGHVENLVGLFTTVIDLGDRDRGGGGQEDDSYWKKTNRQLLRNALELLVQAKGRITVTDLHRLVVSAPTSNEQLRSDTWRNESFCFECLREADAKSSGRAQLDLRLATDFFCIEWPHLSEKTRSIILSTLTSMLDVLGRGLLRELLSPDVTTIRPEMACDGKIILIDLPLKLFGDVGQIAQVIWKHCFQRTMERRDVAANPRPVCLVVDESHLLTTSGAGGGGGDQLFQTTARSARVATIYATQSISNYLAAFGGEKSESEVHSLLGNLQTQVFHQQADTKTNTYASELIGRTRQLFFNSNRSQGATDMFDLMIGGRTDTGGSAGMSEAYEFEVQPSEFTTLRQGGPPHWLVDAIVVRGGRRFHKTGRPWIPITIRQTI